MLMRREIAMCCLRLLCPSTHRHLRLHLHLHLYQSLIRPDSASHLRARLSPNTLDMPTAICKAFRHNVTDFHPSGPGPLTVPISERILCLQRCVGSRSVPVLTASPGFNPAASGSVRSSLNCRANCGTQSSPRTLASTSAASHLVIPSSLVNFHLFRMNSSASRLQRHPLSVL